MHEAGGDTTKLVSDVGRQRRRPHVGFPRAGAVEPRKPLVFSDEQTTKNGAFEEPALPDYIAAKSVGKRGG